MQTTKIRFFMLVKKTVWTVSPTPCNSNTGPATSIYFFLWYIRHQQVPARVGQTAAAGWRGLLVIAARAAQQAQDVEGQDEHHHAQHRHAADPPAEKL